MSHYHYQMLVQQKIITATFIPTVVSTDAAVCFSGLLVKYFSHLYINILICILCLDFVFATVAEYHQHILHHRVPHSNMFYNVRTCDGQGRWCACCCSVKPTHKCMPNFCQDWLYHDHRYGGFLMDFTPTLSKSCNKFHQITPILQMTTTTYQLYFVHGHDCDTHTWNLLSWSWSSEKDFC